MKRMLNISFKPDEGGGSQRPICFHHLLNRTVSSLVLSPDQDQLTLVFDSGQRLTIYSELGGFESGTIGRDGEGGGLWIF
jgi:hypothetical protein